MIQQSKKQTVIGPFTFTDDTPGRVTIQRGNETVNVCLASVPFAALSCIARSHWSKPPDPAEAIAAMHVFWAEHWRR
jgi:hypothetical protein